MQTTPLKPRPVPTPTRKPMSRGMKIGCGVVAGASVLIAFLFVMSVLTTNGTPPPSSPSSNKASSSSSPSDHSTPASRLPVDQQVANLVENAGATGQNMTSSYDARTQAVTITETTEGGFTKSGTVDGIKMDCFDFQKALWTAGIAPQISDVKVTINGSLIDQYGHTTTGLWGSCELTRATAGKFVWNNLTWESAWQDYDSQYIRPDLLQ